MLFTTHKLQGLREEQCRCKQGGCAQRENYQKRLLFFHSSPQRSCWWQRAERGRQGKEKGKGELNPVLGQICTWYIWPQSKTVFGRAQRSAAAMPNWSCSCAISANKWTTTTRMEAWIDWGRVAEGGGWTFCSAAQGRCARTVRCFGGIQHGTHTHKQLKLSSDIQVSVSICGRKLVTYYLWYRGTSWVDTY